MKKHFFILPLTLLILASLNFVNQSYASSTNTNNSGIVTFSESEFSIGDNITQGYTINSLNNQSLSPPISFKTVNSLANAEIATHSSGFTQAGGNVLKGNVNGGGLDLWLDFNSEVTSISFDFLMTCPDVGQNLNNGLLIAALTDTGPTWYEDWYIRANRYSTSSGTATYGNSIKWIPGNYSASGDPANGEGMHEIHFWFDSDNVGCTQYFLDNISFTRINSPACPEIGDMFLNSVSTTSISGNPSLNVDIIFNQGSTYSLPDGVYADSSGIYTPSIFSSSVCPGMTRIHTALECVDKGVYPVSFENDILKATSVNSFSVNPDIADFFNATVSTNYSSPSFINGTINGFTLDPTLHSHCAIAYSIYVPIVIKGIDGETIDISAEVEPNDSVSQIVSTNYFIQPNISVTGDFSTNFDSFDTFQFIATKASHKVILNVPSGSDYNLGSWDSSGNAINNSSNANSQNESFTITTSIGAKYFVKVSKASGTSQYILRIE